MEQEVNIKTVAQNFLLLGIIMLSAGIGIYYFANLSTDYDIPKGSIRIGIGSHNNMTGITFLKYE